MIRKFIGIRFFVVCLLFWIVAEATVGSRVQAQGLRAVTRRTVMTPDGGGMLRPAPRAPRTPPPVAAPRLVRLVNLDPKRDSARKAMVDRRRLAFQRHRAQAGSAHAQYELGIRYLRGDGVAPERITARKWLEASAKQGHRSARKALAKLDAMPRIERPERIVGEAGRKKDDSGVADVELIEGNDESSMPSVGPADLRSE